MSHLTMGHFLYGIAAIEFVTMTVMSVILLNSPEPETDGMAGNRRTRGFVFLFAGIATSVGLILIGTFTEVATMTIF